jgi:ubiquinone biosynthesis protein UbiJ
MSTNAPPPVELAPGADAIAQMVAQVFASASKQEPRLAARLRGAVAMQTGAQGPAFTIHFEQSRIRVATGADGKAQLQLEAPLDALSSLTTGSRTLRALLSRRIRLRGVVRHPIIALRLRRLLSALGSAPGGR